MTVLAIFVENKTIKYLSLGKANEKIWHFYLREKLFIQTPDSE